MLGLWSHDHLSPLNNLFSPLIWRLIQISPLRDLFSDHFISAIDAEANSDALYFRVSLLRKLPKKMTQKVYVLQTYPNKRL